MKRLIFCWLTACLFSGTGFAEDGYRLWLRYEPITNPVLLHEYRQQFQAILPEDKNPISHAATAELQEGLSSLLGVPVPVEHTIRPGTVLLCKTSAPRLAGLHLADTLSLRAEGFRILTVTIQGKPCTLITANTDIGLLYGSFHLLRLLQTQQTTGKLQIQSVPKIQVRILDHWDNLNRTVERGYAGFSIWKWHLLPGYIDPRYKAYARANASIGINGTVINNVNANTLLLTPEYLVKVKALADVFRPYGIKLYLSAKFSAPIEIGKLKTADPLDDQVIAWWKEKVAEIYHYVPDFGGFLVKANSEGQPGPQNYHRTHADGANMLADVLKPYGGIVMWRAFVYSNETPTDRTKQAYDEFKPFDGAFHSNVIIQVKNGPLDFQPREPFHPLFGAMPKTPLMMEFQITQEYLGQGTHLVFEAPLMKETLEADTYEHGKGTTVASIIDGTANHTHLTGIAGVSNIGDDRNWCGHPFAQANWYAFGRLAWDHALSAATIVDEWIRMSFSNNPAFLQPVIRIMLQSRENLVHYMTPLGLHHIMGDGHHYGPSPWSNHLGRADWNPVYYHRADSTGIGFERTKAGSNALEQYAPAVQKIYADPATCPDNYLLWFHHIPWNYRMKSGKTLWQELVDTYYAGVEAVRAMQKTWEGLRQYVDPERFEHVQMLMAIQEKEAVWWRNACLLYFGTFSKMPIPAAYEQPDHTLKYYQSLRFPFAPGTGGAN
ncbi:MAG TPA: alpha-glucuronidase family glycosyl hydrolase [Sediminibacterium sp.]|nr:alpha-glucuronidase family glycosyl hydrolase [Sediminibacterium sp.]